MKLVKCSNGHFYDAEANDTCPYCEDMDNDNKTVQDDSSMIYGGRHPAMQGQAGMPQMPKPGQTSPMSAMPQPPVMNSVPPVPPAMPKPPVMNNVPPVPPVMPKPPVMNNVPPAAPYMTGMTQAAPVTQAPMGNMQAMPQTSMMNNMSGVPQTPMMNNMPNMPQAPMMNNMSGVPQTPMMNNMPNMPQAPMMNSMSGMPQASMMNNMPNMPQTPVMNNMSNMSQPAPQLTEINSLPVTGWLVCVSGEAKGRSYNIVNGSNYIGRRKDMDICIEGDISISRYRHAVIEYSDEKNEFLIKLGESKEKIYITRDRQKRILEGTIKLEAYDVITLGRTELMFVPFCGEKFTW